MLPLQLPTAPLALPDSALSKHQEWQMLSTLPVDDLISKLINQVVTLAINVTIAIVVFYVGKFIIKKLLNIITSILVRRGADTSLSTFILSLSRIVLYFVLIVTVIGILGIETSSFIAIFASAGVAVGMALSGTLQNFAGGVLILLLKPYKVGDYIETQGFAGYVTEVQIFHTIINTYDNKSIIIPNGGLSTGTINNWSRERYRRVEWAISISYGDDVEAARKAICRLLTEDPRVISERPKEEEQIENSAKRVAEGLNEKPLPWYRRILSRRKPKTLVQRINDMPQKQLPVEYCRITAPTVWVNSLGESSVNLVARAWTRNKDYWALYYEMYERIYSALPSHGLRFPFPQMDVHMREP